MTWCEWTQSSYNIVGVNLGINGEDIFTSGGWDMMNPTTSTNLLADDIIVASVNYLIND